MKQTSSIRWATWLAVSGGAFWIAFHLYIFSPGLTILNLALPFFLPHWAYFSWRWQFFLW